MFKDEKEVRAFMSEYVYSFLTKPLMLSLQEARGWGITEKALEAEVDFALKTAFRKHDEKEAAREAGY